MLTCSSCQAPKRAPNGESVSHFDKETSNFKRSESFFQAGDSSTLVSVESPFGRLLFPKEALLISDQTLFYSSFILASYSRRKSGNWSLFFVFFPVFFLLFCLHLECLEQFASSCLYNRLSACRSETFQAFKQSSTCAEVDLSRVYPQPDAASLRAEKTKLCALLARV